LKIYIADLQTNSIASPVKIPDKLEDWTYEKIKELVDNNVNESETHDFKVNIPDATTLTDLCCAFANSPPNGGFIILGIGEIGSRFHIEGIKSDKELSHKFGQKIRAVSTINPPLPKIISIPSKPEILAVFHIPFSEEGPHIPIDEDKRIFWKRTNKGKEHMTYDEIKMAFQRIPFEERKKHSAYFNEILRKLSVISYSTKPNKTLFLEVPTDYNDYIRNMATIMFSAGSEKPYPVRWTDIKYLDHLEWVLSHLKHQEYNHIHQTWLDLNRLIAEYNEHVLKSIPAITEIIAKHIIQDYPSFSQEPSQGNNDVFFLNRIFRLIFENYYYYILGDKSRDFELQINPLIESDNFQIVLIEREPSGSGVVGINKIPLIASPRKEKLDVNKLRQTLISICEDKELVNHFCNLNNRITEIDKVKQQFSYQSSSLIKNIDAGYIMKGSCLLGY
jgi:Putative DNA-binding domain